jgi:hypothetical protein
MQASSSPSRWLDRTAVPALPPQVHMHGGIGRIDSGSSRSNGREEALVWPLASQWKRPRLRSAPTATATGVASGEQRPDGADG